MDEENANDVLHVDVNMELFPKDTPATEAIIIDIVVREFCQLAWFFISLFVVLYSLNNNTNYFYPRSRPTCLRRGFMRISSILQPTES